jgi:transcriptional regulator with XRE-family HTH domain
MSDAPLTSEQVKAARQLLGWSQAKLAMRVGVGEKTLMAFEAREQAPPRSTPLSTDWARARLESAGVEFIAENGDEPRLRQALILTATRRHGARSIRKNREMKNSTTRIELRLSEDLSSQIDAYIAALPTPRPSRSEAIRRLLAVGLAASK